jgi:F-type H+-transporting ATPase subunit alpha
MSISIMAVTLFAVNKGYFDDIEVKKVLAFEAGLHGYMKTKQAALLAKIEETKQLDKDGEAALAAAVADFKKSGAY